MKKGRILYIEDEMSLGKIVKDTLEKQGYEITWETDGAKVISHLDSFRPDICIVDIMLPNIDGYSLSRTIRGIYSSLPIIFLTAKTNPEDAVRGFESGGTDYLRKPFSIEELIARIENQLNLCGRKEVTNPKKEFFEIGKFIINTLNYELSTDGRIIKLTNRDMQVIKHLYANRNQAVSRKELLLTVWGDDSYFNSRNLDVYIRKLRRYFSDDPEIQLITLKGSGYIFMLPETKKQPS
jgi:DNA-binding response OmpR family regulator